MSTNGAGAPIEGLRLLTRAEIEAAPDLARETVPVPEWGEGAAVLVQAMDVNRRLAWLEFGTVIEKNPTTGEREYSGKPFTPGNSAVAALCIIDAAGEPMFTLVEIDVLGKKNPDVIARIADVGLRLSHLGKYGAEVAVDVPKDSNGSSPAASRDTSV